jgi:ATP-dependent DNA ligase
MTQLRRPLAPMEALLVDSLPIGKQWQYEPKWDGFRCIAFRSGEKFVLQSKSGRPLTRYFPEMVQELMTIKQKNFVLDGELVIPISGQLSFDDLLMRIHPAASRVKKLAAQTPALFIVFDLLENSDGSLLKYPLAKRRQLLERFAKQYFRKAGRIALSPMTRDAKVARRWFASAGRSLDGVIAKRVDLEYRSGDRTGMQKVKPRRTADCVVGGFRYATGKRVVGSLLLGLFDNEGRLNHVGFTASFKQSERGPLAKRLQALIKPPGFTGNAPGGPSRWSTKRSMEWRPLAPKLVVEVQYDHFTGGRFRHGTKLVRWRPDKAPRQCGMDQVANQGSESLKLLTKTG